MHLVSLCCLLILSVVIYVQLAITCLYILRSGLSIFIKLINICYL